MSIKVRTTGYWLVISGFWPTIGCLGKLYPDAQVAVYRTGAINLN